MDSAAPKSWIRGLEVFNELLDVAPDGVAGNVGIDCPGEEEPFVEELSESVEFRCVWCDFGCRERLEHVVEGFLETEERVEDFSKVGESFVKCRFHCVCVARESLGDRCQKGVDSASGDHHFLRGVDDASELVLEISAEVFFGKFSVGDPFVGFRQCGLA